MIRSLDLMANRVMRQINLGTSLTYKTSKVYEWLNACYKDTYTKHFWPKTIQFYTVTWPVNSGEITLDKRIGQPMRVDNQTDGNTIYLIDPAAFADKTMSLRNVFRNFLDSVLADETPVGTYLGISNVLAQPSATGIVKISSSASADTSGKVFVRGVSAANEVVTDTISLNGATVVNGTTAFAAVESISKTVSTTGLVTVMDAAGNTVATINSWEVSPEYQRLKFEETANQNSTLSICAQRAFVPFLNSADVPLFDCEEALVHGATAQAWREQAELARAAMEDALYDRALKELVTRHLEMSGNANLMLPMGRA